MVCVTIAFIYLLNTHQSMSNKLSLTVKPPRSIRKRNCTVILHNPLGRLGNVLFEFASAYGLSLEHSCRLYIGPGLMRELNQYFELNLSDLLTESEFNRTSPIQQMYNHCTYFPGLFQPNTSQHIELVGYWQAQKHFFNQTDQIREQLRFRSTVLDPVKKFIERTFKNTTKTLVGVHIRRGDFLGQRKISSDQFIFDAMAYFTRKYNSTKFILVSDDKNYIRNVFGKRNDTFFTPDSFTAAQDMALLTLCDHVIITVGTYGWWGGYLLHNRTGEVLTDSKPDHSPVDVNCEASVFFPHWFKFLN
jgi:galactoside 2-L-fucosyltransferase 1/2